MSSKLEIRTCMYSRHICIWMKKHRICILILYHILQEVSVERMEIKLAGDELYEEFQRIYDESVDRGAGKDKAEDKMWNRGRGR